MLKTKGSLTGKPSKASLKSRGLHSSLALRLSNNGTKTPSLDGRYSLYSTDSEDNIACVNKGLDKCAELLTNILEIKGEKDVQRQQCQPMFHNTKKQKCDLNTKHTSNKEKAGSQKLKRKSRTGIHIPRKPGQSNVQLSSKPTYNKHVVSSTPVSMVVQRQRQQELQYKESLLQKQIELLQAQYENLQKDDNNDQGRQDSNPQIHAEILPQLLTTHDKQVNYNENSGDHQPRTARKSLEFPSNAEKPLIDNLEEQGSTGIENACAPGQNEGNLEDEMQKSTVRKVQFVKQNLHEDQGENQNPSEIFQSDLSKADSSPCGNGGKRKINQFKKGSLQHPSPHRNTDHLRILTYLIGELKAVLGTTDIEVERLLMEIKNEIHLLSYTVQYSQTPPVLTNAGKQHDIDTEVALQPLRSENSDLRRKLRIANQRMREMENQCRNIPQKDQTPPHARNKELVENLHYQVLKERKSAEKFKHEVQLAEKRFTDYNKDKLNLEHIVSEKEKDLHTLQEKLERQKGKTMTVDTQAKLQLESIEITLNAKNKEVGLLHIALEQRDAEIGRLTELTRGLQQSLTRVLSNVQELHPDDVISDVSTISSVFDTRQAVGQKTLRTRAAGVMTSSNFTSQLQPWDDDFYDHTKAETHTEEHHKMSEYDKIKEDIDQNGDSSQHDSTDDASADEFVFKQELANLDTVIARLQDSLRDKV